MKREEVGGRPHLEYCGVLEAEHRENILVDEQSKHQDDDEDGSCTNIHSNHTQYAAAHKSVSCCHNITRVSIQPACQAGDGSSLYSSGGTSRVTASQASEPPSGVLTAHYGRKEKWISLL